MIQVIVVDYKAAQHSELEENLRRYGIDVTVVNDFVQLIMHLFNRHVDIVIFNFEVSGAEDVLAIRNVRSLRNLQSLGIIILASRYEVDQRLELVASGADAFLSQPVKIEELIAYIKNIYRRTNSCEDAIPPLQWHFHRSEWRLVTPSGASLTLSHMEVNLMEMLVKSLGKPVKRRDIITLGFGLDPLSYDSRRLDSIVSRLRRKVHEVHPLSQPIKVIHSVGYIFTEPIKSD